jgi:3-oxoacyl-(acyl-carrier-protein) synthase
MDLLSRLAVAGAGLLFRETGLSSDGCTTGFVTGTSCGCLNTDISYIRTLSSGQPSPLIFSYTLPNIAPSEAAAFFRLEGPVYSIVDTDEPYKAALSEAVRLLDFLPDLDLMIFGRLDACPESVPVVRLNAIEKETDRRSRTLQRGGLPCP